MILTVSARPWSQRSGGIIILRYRLGTVHSRQQSFYANQPWTRRTSR